MCKLHIIILTFFLAFQFSCKGPESGEKKQIVTGSVLSDGVPEILFSDTEYDLGKMKKGERLIAWFDFKNIGNAPLFIQNVTASCGCTVPEWSKDPIVPGEKNSIKVIFDSSGKRGLQNIKVSVYSNARSEINVLYLKGMVIDN